MFQNGPVFSNDEVAFFDAGHRFENMPLLLVLLRALPSAAVHLQLRVLQVIICYRILFIHRIAEALVRWLTCFHAFSRGSYCLIKSRGEEFKSSSQQ